MKNSSFIAIISAYIIWGFISIPLKMLNQYPSGMILYFRLGFALVLLFLILLLFRSKQLKQNFSFFKNMSGIQKREFILLNILGGILLTANWLIFIYVINNIDIQTGSFAYLICPILTAVLGFLILKEKLSQTKWVAIALGVLSCVMLATGSFVNLLFSLLVATTYAAYIISQKNLKEWDKIVLLFIQLLVAFGIIAPFYAWFNPEGISPDLFFVEVVIVISLCFTIIPLFLSLFALNKLSSGTVGILMYINPILNFYLAFFIFKEETTTQQVLAYLLIAFSVIIYNVNFEKIRKKKPQKVLS